MNKESNQSGYTVNVFQLEEDFDGHYADAWFRENWSDSVRHAAIYVLLVFAGKWYMQKRPGFELRILLSLWSSFLAVFSICGAIRTLPELLYILNRYGLDRSVCDNSYRYGPTTVWAYLFTLSKLYELGDTAFIVLRKKNLIFLHWYHHASALVYAWYSYNEPPSMGRWLMVMNYVIHSMMYTYYAFRAMRFRIPTYVRMAITGLQILQMMTAIFVTVRASMIKVSGGHCQVTDSNLAISFFIYPSYFVLFVRFFYVRYIASKTTAGVPTDPTKQGLKVE